MKNMYLLGLIVTFFISCTSDRLRLLNEAEVVLPGSWEIESIGLPSGNDGIAYQGTRFYSDTTLFNVGSIEIPSFSTDSLDINSHPKGKIRIEVTIDNESFPFAINSMFISGEEIFTNIQFNGSDGIHIPDTDAEEFIWSSFILNDNYIFQINDNDNIEIHEANASNGRVLVLHRT